MGFGPSYGPAPAGCEGTLADQRHAGRQAGEDSEKTQLAWSRPRKMWQRLDDRGAFGSPLGRPRSRTLDHPHTERCAEPEPCKD